jgi:hypothetical protein
MPPRPDQPARPPAARPPAREVVWLVATRDLYVGGHPGTGAVPQIAHRAGGRVSAKAAALNGWLPFTRPAEK